MGLKKLTVVVDEEGYAETKAYLEARSNKLNNLEEAATLIYGQGLGRVKSLLNYKEKGDKKRRTEGKAPRAKAAAKTKAAKPKAVKAAKPKKEKAATKAKAKAKPAKQAAPKAAAAPKKPASDKPKSPLVAASKKAGVNRLGPQKPQLAPVTPINGTSTMPLAEAAEA